MIIIKYVIAVIILGIIILFHELGHFLMAKKNNIRVNEFSLGLGPTIIGFKKGETKYSLKLLPFGGACMMEGEDSESEDSRSFQKQSVLARIAVVVGGPLFNFIMAFVLSIIIIGSVGYVKPVVSNVIEGYPAAEAGLQNGDEIIRLNNSSIHFFQEVSMFTLFHKGETVKVTYLRNGEKHSTTLTPKLDKKSGQYMFGFYNSSVYTHPGPLKTVFYSVYNVKYWIQYTFGSLKMLVTHQVALKDMSGPVGIVKTIGDTYSQSQAEGTYYAVMNLINITILLSANIGVLNLLPIPALDGGRLVFLIIELIRGKKVSQEKEGLVHFVGLVCLLGLMVLIMFNDIRKLL